MMKECRERAIKRSASSAQIPDWLTPSQAAELLQVHPQTVRVWIREGRIPSQNFGGSRRIPRDELLATRARTTAANRSNRPRPRRATVANASVHSRRPPRTTASSTVTNADAAQMLGISRATIERWVRAGRFTLIAVGANQGKRRIVHDERFELLARAARRHMTPPEAISQRDAATRLGISRATVERWVNQGRLNTIRTGERGGARRVLVDDAFHAAKNASRKIPHPPRGAAQKIPHASESLGQRKSEATPSHSAAPFGRFTQPIPQTESLTGSAGKTHLDAPPRVDLPPESLAPNASRIPHAVASKNPSRTPARRPPAPCTMRRLPLRVVSASRATCLMARPRSPHQRDQLRPPNLAAWLERGGRGREQQLAILVVAVVAAAALAIYSPWNQSRRTETAPTRQAAGARGAQAQATVSARDRAAATPTRHTLAAVPPGRSLRGRLHRGRSAPRPQRRREACQRLTGQTTTSALGGSPAQATPDHAVPVQRHLRAGNGVAVHECDSARSA